MKFLIKNTKIVSTFGPAITKNLNLFGDSDSNNQSLIIEVKSLIHKLFVSGVNCVRFNFSHGLVDENNTRLAMIHEVHKDMLSNQASDRKFLRASSLLADTKGPEIRVFDMGSNGVDYVRDQEVIVNCLIKKQGTKDAFSVVDATGSYNMANDCIVGNEILIEDGKLNLSIIEVNKAIGVVKAVVRNSYKLKTNKRINLPGADYSMKFLSDKDISDIKYSIDQGFEFLALSFVNSAKDIKEVRDLISSYCKERNIPSIIQVYSKIETTSSCKNIDEIIDASDGIMIARGDLGLEIPYFEVPYWTKQIIYKCRKANKPVITATQMLDSLERNVVATRAEVSDVYRAAELGSDCTMLSGETAQGLFPAVAVSTMTNIVFESEKRFNTGKFLSLFMENMFRNLSEDVQHLCKSLIGCLSSITVPASLVVKYEDITDEFLVAFSAMRINFPLFVFISVKDASVYSKEPNWFDSDYVLLKRVSRFSLYRGINLIFVSNTDKSISAKTLFQEFLASMQKDAGCQITTDALYLSQAQWSK